MKTSTATTTTKTKTTDDDLLVQAARDQPQAERDRLVAAVHQRPLFKPGFAFSSEMKGQLDHDGHIVLPGLMNEEMIDICTRALHAVQADNDAFNDQVAPLRQAWQSRFDSAERDGRDEEFLEALHNERWSPGAGGGEFNLVLDPQKTAAESSPCFEGIMGHPELVQIVASVLGEDFRVDHVCTMNRGGGDSGMGWHSHGHSDMGCGGTDHGRGFLRVFFYVSGFALDDGNLKVIPGSHLHDEPIAAPPCEPFDTDAEAEQRWMKGRTHPLTGEPLAIEHLACPPGSVILMWTHAAHAVQPKPPYAPPRVALIAGFRQPKCFEVSKWMTPSFYRRPTVGLPPDAKDFAVLDHEGNALPPNPTHGEFRP